MATADLISSSVEDIRSTADITGVGGSDECPIATEHRPICFYIDGLATTVSIHHVMDHTIATRLVVAKNLNMR